MFTPTQQQQPQASAGILTRTEQLGGNIFSSTPTTATGGYIPVGTGHVAPGYGQSFTSTVEQTGRGNAFFPQTGYSSSLLSSASTGAPIPSPSNYFSQAPENRILREGIPLSSVADTSVVQSVAPITSARTGLLSTLSGDMISNPPTVSTITETHTQPSNLTYVPPTVVQAQQQIVPQQQFLQQQQQQVETYYYPHYYQLGEQQQLVPMHYDHVPQHIHQHFATSVPQGVTVLSHQQLPNFDMRNVQVEKEILHVHPVVVQKEIQNIIPQTVQKEVTYVTPRRLVIQQRVIHPEEVRKVVEERRQEGQIVRQREEKLLPEIVEHKTEEIVSEQRFAQVNNEQRNIPIGTSLQKSELVPITITSTPGIVSSQPPISGGEITPLALSEQPLAFTSTLAPTMTTAAATTTAISTTSSTTLAPTADVIAPTTSAIIAPTSGMESVETKHVPVTGGNADKMLGKKSKRRWYHF